MSTLLYSSAELRAAIHLENEHNVEIGTSLNADGTYAAATLESWEKDILPAFRRWMIENDMWAWHKKHDCDDKANALKLFAQRCFQETSHKVVADGFAVWRVWYMTRDGGGHAINRALTDKGFVYIEPQTAQVVELTKKEEASKWLEY